MAKSKKKNQKISIVITKDTLIALVVIILLAAIALAVLYFAFPDTWDVLVELVVGPQDSAPNGQPNINVGPAPIIAGELNIYFIDVGQGDSILTVLPNSETILIDGGDRDEEISKTVISTLKSLNINTLDHVILTHTDSDHCGSLDDAILSVENVKNIYVPKIQTKENLLPLDNGYPAKTTIVYNDFIKASKSCTYLDENNVRKSSNIKYLEDIIEINDMKVNEQGEEECTYRFAMFCRNDDYYRNMNTSDAHDLNDVSPICVLSCNNRLIVYTGDANYSNDKTSSEKNFLDEMISRGYTDSDVDDKFDADILKVAHHGSKGSSGQDFLDYIDCEYAVISSGGDVINNDGIDEGSGRKEYDLYLSKDYDDNKIDLDYFHGNKKHEHPHSDVCKDGGRLEQSGILKCFYTVLYGTIHCNIDTSSNIKFTTEYQPIFSGNTISFPEKIPA